MKKMMFFCTVLMLVFGLFATAHADVISYAVSWDNIYNGLFTFYNGTTGAEVFPTIEPPAYTTYSSATINGSGNVQSLGPVLTPIPLGPVMVALGTPSPANSGDMTQIGVQPTTYSVGQAEIVSAQNYPTNTTGIQAVNKAESNVIAPPSTQAAAQGNNLSTTAVTFTLVLDDPGGTILQFEGKAAPYMDALITTTGGSTVALGSVANASLSASLSIYDQNNLIVFQWAPNGLPGGVFGGTEILDPFSLNTALSVINIEDENIYDPTGLGGAVIGDFDPAALNNLFRVVTGELGPGRYTVTLSMTENTSVTANEQVPEPGTILLVGAGLLSLVGISRRKKM